MLALGVLAVVGGCAPGTAPSDSLPAIEGPLDPVPASARGEPLPLLIDTDVASDDLVALASLVGSPRVEVRAITVSGTGEAHCGHGVDVVLRLLERLGAPPIAVACGRETPIAGDHAFPDAWRLGADHGSGLALPSTSRAPYAGDAVQLISETNDAVEGLRVLTLGPMTNLADALGRGPNLAQRLETVYAMGGALLVSGNVAVGDFIARDKVAEVEHLRRPDATSGGHGSRVSPGAPGRLRRHRPGAGHPGVRGARPAGGDQFGRLVLAELFAEHPFMTDGTYFLWDPLAAAMAADYPLGSFSAARVDVEEAEGPEVGFTRPVEGTPNVEYLSAAGSCRRRGHLARDTELEGKTPHVSLGVPLEWPLRSGGQAPEADALSTELQARGHDQYGLTHE